MTFIDLIKNAIFEEEPQGKLPAKPASQGPRMAAAPASALAPMSMPVSSGASDQFYGRLAKQTELSVIPELAKIESFAAPLQSIIQDKSLRYKAAMATAQSQAGLTREGILNGFDKLLSVLESSATSFNKQSDEVASTEVDAKSQQLKDLKTSIEQKSKEIADMQQQMKSLESAVEVSRAKLQQAKATFTAAYERRKSEIQQQRREIETILQ
jgi:chromosome segregation ATPase